MGSCLSCCCCDNENDVSDKDDDNDHQPLLDEPNPHYSSFDDTHGVSLSDGCDKTKETNSITG